jgi:hypothetical protein
METKICTKCKETKPLNLFRVDSRLKSGRGAWCQRCTANASLKSRNKNIKKARESFKNWAAKDPAKETERKLKWAKENREKTLAAGRRYYHTHRDARVKAQKKTRAANKEKYAERQKEWRKNNMGYVLAANALRNANKLQRTPKWLTKEDKKKISQLYKQARHLTETTGEQHHVDHIIPLQGKLVSGLHVPSNLQILHWKDNLSKHHKYVPQ